MMDNDKLKQSPDEVPDYDDGRMVFYYSREHRLARASAAVRELNEARPPQKQGFIRSLTSNKSHTFTFISLIVLCAAVVLYSVVTPRGSKEKLIHDMLITVQAVQSGEQSLITLKKTIKGDNSYSGDVGLVISPSEDGMVPIHAEKIYFTPEDEEAFSFTVPFTAKTLLVILDVNEEKYLLKVSPK